MEELKQKAREEFTERFAIKVTTDKEADQKCADIMEKFWEKGKLTPMADFWLEKIDQAIKQDRERTIKLIKEKGLHLGYANDIINLLQANQ